MDHRERFHKLMQFQPVDRLPVVEWAVWWNQTIDRWRGEGLPESCQKPWEVTDYFELDPYRQVVASPFKPGAPGAPSHGAPIIHSEADYENLKAFLFPDPPEVMDPFSQKPVVERLADLADAHSAGEVVIWLTMEGFFWFPRVLLGIEKHLYAFYEQPELMQRINRDLLDWERRVTEAVMEVTAPDFMTFAEDMSYNHGPMIGADMFEMYMAPCYREIVPMLEEGGTKVIIDSDGEISALLPWYEQCGVRGFLPLERQAGCDIGAMREAHPRVCFVGAYDKMVMPLGEAEMRAEFERLLPVMRQGGYIPSVDHQTPPSVSMENYRIYLALLREYAERACQA